MYVDEYILSYLRTKNLLQAENNYYDIFGHRAPNFREKLEEASSMAAGLGKYRDLREYLLFGVMQTPLTSLQMLSIENYILPAYYLGNYAEASHQYHLMFGFDVLPFSNLVECFNSSTPELVFRR